MKRKPIKWFVTIFAFFIGSGFSLHTQTNVLTLSDDSYFNSELRSLPSTYSERKLSTPKFILETNREKTIDGELDFLEFENTSPVLRGPGGEPIGGVPTGDALWVVGVLSILFAGIKYQKRNSK